MLEPVDHYKKFVREGHPHIIYKRSSPPHQEEPEEEKVACSVKSKSSSLVFFRIMRMNLILRLRQGKQFIEMVS